MKKIAIISFTDHGSKLNQKISRALSEMGCTCEAYAIERYADAYQLKPRKESLSDWTGKMFRTQEAILFISATGIAVRSIAPFVQHKAKDPAIVVMDEQGKFVISLMSGHLGGANELTGILAGITGAIPVITTATDVNDKFAVDVFARQNQLCISDIKKVRMISSGILDHKKIGFYSEVPVKGQMPEELVMWEVEKGFREERGIAVSIYEKREFYPQTLVLIPRTVAIGIGCRRGTSMEKIEEKVRKVLEKNGLSMRCIEQIASIDLKKEEEGILGFARKYQLDFVTFTAEELRKAEGDFSPSDFVKNVTGVDNVCERSAVLASESGALIQKKNAGDGVTVALAVRKRSVHFEE